MKTIIETSARHVHLPEDIYKILFLFEYYTEIEIFYRFSLIYRLMSVIMNTTYRECARDKLVDRTATCLKVRCSSLTDRRLFETDTCRKRWVFFRPLCW
jgi:hypothetical protein